MEQVIRLTEWSEGSGCGCKIAPAILDQILQASGSFSQKDPNLLVGNSSKDDAAVYQVSEDLAMINTVDFFTPIVDMLLILDALLPQMPFQMYMRWEANHYLPMQY